MWNPPDIISGANVPWSCVPLKWLPNLLQNNIYACPHGGQEENTRLAKQSLAFLTGTATDIRETLEQTGFLTCSKVGGDTHVRLSGKMFTVRFYREGENLLVEATEFAQPDRRDARRVALLLHWA